MHLNIRPRYFFILLLLLIVQSVSAQVNTNNREIRQEVREQNQENREQIKESRKVVIMERKEQREARKEERNQLTGEIQLSGAFALYPMIVTWAEEFRKLYPNVRIDISAGGSGKGITDALSGIVELGMVSRDVHSVEREKGAMVISVAKDAVVCTVNSKNPLYLDIMTKGMSLEDAKRLWAADDEIKTWGEILGTSSTLPVHIYTRSDACGAAETWANWLGVSQEDMKGTAVYGDPGIASVIQRDKVGIGFNNIAYAYDLKNKKPHRKIMVMPIDLNNDGKIDLSEGFYTSLSELNQAIMDGKYPTPPARELFLVCKNEQQRSEVIAFLSYILLRGQQYNFESGYIPLDEEEIAREIKKVKSIASTEDRKRINRTTQSN